MRQLIAVCLTLAFLGGLALLGVRAMDLGSPPASASHAGGMDAMSIDMDPSSAPANTATSIGSVQTCARVNENNALDADEDSVDTLQIDVTALNIPASNPMTGFAYALGFPTGSIEVATENQLFLLNSLPGSSLFAGLSDGLPDSVSPWNATAVDGGPNPASSETGSGVLDRLTIQTFAGSVAGLFPLTLTGNAHVDTTSVGRSPDVTNNAQVAVNGPCSVSCPDSDYDSTCDVSDPDDDGDKVYDIDEGPCGSDPMNPNKRPERIDGAFAGVDDDGDLAIDEALPAGAANFDCDGDGYKGSAESGTPLCGNAKNDDDKVGVALLPDDAVIDDGCPGGPAQAGAFSEAQFNIGLGDQDPCGLNGWPSDFITGGIPDSTNKINVLDLTSFIAPVALKRLNTAPGQPTFDKRWDLVPGRGVFTPMINVTDLTALIAASSGFPPMLGGVRAFSGPACTDLPVFGRLTSTDMPDPYNNAATPGPCPCDDLFKVEQDSGDPLYLHSGQYHITETDLRIAGRGFDWSFTRTYRSDIISDGPLGRNWDHEYFRRLTNGAAGDIVRLDGSGRADVYDVQLDGSYVAPAGFYTSLAKNLDASFTERDSTGGRIDYAPFDSTGFARMTRTVDRNGNTMTFQYNGLRQLTSVVDTLGRSISYTYNGAGRLTLVTDFMGRAITFAYDGNGDLVSVTSPAVTGTPNGNDFPSGKTTKYSYLSGTGNGRLDHNLVSVTAPNEVAAAGGGPGETGVQCDNSVDDDGDTKINDGCPMLVLQYETNALSPDFDRVLSQKKGGTNGGGVPAGGTITYSYAVLNPSPPSPVTDVFSRTMVTDRNGNLTEYEFNQLGNILTKREYTNRDVRAGDPASFVRTYQYNSDSQLLASTQPSGNSASGTFDNGDIGGGQFDRLQQGNRLQGVITPDSRGGDQTSITGATSYEPIYNQTRSTVDPRGNDPSYVPQNGGATSPARYTTLYTFDYEESCNFGAIGANIGLTAAQVQQRLTDAGMCAAPLGDVNGDGITSQVNGNLIRVQSPSVILLAGSNQAILEGSTAQPVVELYRYNQFGQLISTTDPEANVGVSEYYPENDPDGDGTINNPSGNTLTGGYLKQTTSDTAGAAIRNSGTNPAPVSIRNRYSYDPVGNVTRTVDGRGIATGYSVNQLNQVVQTKRAAALNVYAPDPVEPGPLTAFQYISRTFYDANGNVVLSQVEDRGNTSNVDGNPPTVDLPATASNPDPAGGAAYADTVYKYDVMDKQIEVLAEAANGGGAEFLRARYRYDRNENQVLVIQPEGNAASSVYDERDLLFQTTTGALTPPPANCPSPAPCALMAVVDPTNYDVRGGLPSTGTYHYDANGSLIETVDADDTDSSAANNSGLGGAGDRTRYIYDGFDRLTSVVDSAGNQSVTQYDPAGNIVRVSRFGPTGGTSPISDGPGTLLLPVSSAGTIQSGNLVTANLLESTESRYDELSRSFQTDRALFVNTIATVRTPDVDDGATSLGKGDLTPGDTCAVPGIAAPTYLGCVSTRSEYDRNSRGAFTVEDDADTSRAFYDGVGRVIKTLDAQGNTVETAYDDNSNAIETRETDISQVGGVASEVFLTTYFYDSLNRLERDVSNIGQTDDYRYDSRDNLVCVADAQGPAAPAITRRAFSGGALTVNTANLFGNVTQYFYDGLSRSVRDETILTATGQGDGSNIGCTAEGVKTATPAPDTNQGGGDGLIRVGSLWDQNSLQSALLDDQGNVTVYLYDNLDRRITETKGLTVNTTPLDKTKILGSRNVLTPASATIDSPASISAALITTQLTAAKTRVNAVASLFPALADAVSDNPPTTIAINYDPDGNVPILEDENDSEKFTRFDALNRAIAVRAFRSGQSDSHSGDPVFAPAPSSDPSNPSTSFPAIIGTTKLDYQYDGLSRVVRGTDNNEPSPTADDSIITHAYDSLSRMIEESQQIGALSAKAISSSWRAENLPSELIYPQSGSFSRQLDYAYDVLDRLNTLKDTGPTMAIAGYDYIGGRVLQRSHPINGTRMTYLDNAGTADTGYDGIRRTVQLRHLRADNSTVVGFTHTYDRMNNKLGEVKLHNAANNENYGYDAAYRLTDFERPGGGAIAPLHDNWQLDGTGNWDQLTSTESGSPVTETRQHSSFNEITARNPGAALTVLSDDNGNEVDDGELLLRWDYGNRLRQVNRKSDSALLAVYTYDAAGRRIRKVVTNSGALDGTTDFYLDGWQEIEERNGSDALVQQYVYGGTYIDEPLVLDRNLGGGDSAIGGGDQRLFYHQNTLYSTFALTDTAGVIKEGYQYDAYGRQVVYAPGSNSAVDFGGDDMVTVGGVSAVGNADLFTGRRLDGETGLYYYRMRYLDSGGGRFISRDPIGSWADRANLGNAYGYVAGNPPSLLDPSGRAGQSSYCNKLCQEPPDKAWAFLNRPGGPGPNLGANDWHALHAMTMYYASQDLSGPGGIWAPITLPLLQMIGLGYEVKAVVYQGQGPFPYELGYQGQSLIDWLFDTPWDLVANLIGSMIGVGGGDPMIASRAGQLLPGPDHRGFSTAGVNPRGGGIFGQPHWPGGALTGMSETSPEMLVQGIRDQLAGIGRVLRTPLTAVETALGGDPIAAVGNLISQPIAGVGEILGGGIECAVGLVGTLIGHGWLWGNGVP